MSHAVIRFRTDVMDQLSLRGFDKELARRIRELARREHVSLNKAALLLMRRGAPHVWITATPAR